MTRQHHAYIIFLTLVLAGTLSFAQQVKPDTTGVPEYEFFDMIGDSVGDPGDYPLPEIIFIPSDVLYDRSWDNVNVRQKRQDLTQMEDTVEIILGNPSENPFVFPYHGKFISPFGYRGRHFHAGVDIKCNHGDTIVSAFDGKVRLARPYRGYGNVIVIRHYNGLETVYSHLSKMLAAVNQDVKAGEIIGLGGRTGRATTAHLHFETRFLGEPFNPETFIDIENGRLITDTLLIHSSLFSYRAAAGTKKKGQGEQAATPALKKSAKGHYHKVRSGDTLSSIARAHGTTVKALCRLNRITVKTLLKPGRRIKVR